VPTLAVVEVDVLVELEVLVEADVPEADVSAAAAAVVLEPEEADDVDPPAADVCAVSDVFSLARTAGGEAAAMISAGVGTCRGACPGSTCTV
jgi:hypothetical protein